MNASVKTNERINNFLEEHEIWSLKAYNVMHHEENFVVLKTPENQSKIYIMGKNAYTEKVPIFPLFSFQEIKKAIIYRELTK